jgi:hypothetical protein
MSTRKSDGRSMSDAEVAEVDAYWAKRCANASAKLLVRLQKFHPKKTAPEDQTNEPEV